MTIEPRRAPRSPDVRPSRRRSGDPAHQVLLVESLMRQERGPRHAAHRSEPPDPARLTPQSAGAAVAGLLVSGFAVIAALGNGAGPGPDLGTGAPAPDAGTAHASGTGDGRLGTPSPEPAPEPQPVDVAGIADLAQPLAVRNPARAGSVATTRDRTTTVAAAREEDEHPGRRGGPQRDGSGKPDVARSDAARDRSARDG